MSFFDYELPEDRIAQEPLEDRSASKLLVLRQSTGEIEDRTFCELGDLLEPGDLLVLNDTRVTAKRVMGRRQTGAKVELLFLHSRPDGSWECLARPAKRLHDGESILIDGLEGRVRIVADLGGGRKIVQPEGGSNSNWISSIGDVPLPPYIVRALADPERYQTVYSRSSGSAAAPTAGLHFTPDLLKALVNRGVDIAHVTLDVSLDTFRPVTADDPSDHSIHGEICRVNEDTARKVSNCRKRIFAVGTTTVRTLESFAVGPRQIASGESRTRLFIRPGYKYLVVDGVVTNFHMARTTMLLMIAALAGEEPIQKAYSHALQTGYRFLSFGDAMLLL